EVRASWSELRTASKAGKLKSNGTCSVYTDHRKDNFSNPEGGCYPNMPREYSDEPGTDHTTGIALAHQMFAENPDPSAMRVVVLLTDGVPNGISSGHGAIRATEGYS